MLVRTSRIRVAHRLRQGVVIAALPLIACAPGVQPECDGGIRRWQPGKSCRRAAADRYDHRGPDALRLSRAVCQPVSVGLGATIKSGAIYTNAYQDHANTETAPGHATILSGREPYRTGIVLNAIGVPDSRAPLIGGGGPGASPFRFRGTALIDWMKAKDRRSRALSVSRKDRGAILPIGRAKENVYWYASNGKFTTSTYYADTLPTWVQRFNARRMPQQYAGKAWEPLLPLSAYPEPDTVSVEDLGREPAFPHRLVRGHHCGGA